MKLISPVFEDRQNIPPKYAYGGGNISPPLAVSDIPNNIKTWAIVVDDPDAPGGHFTHWLVWNIPSNALVIQEGTLPEGAEQGCNDFGNNRWDGPAPPSGTHRYVFTAYALNGSLALKSSASRAELEMAISSNVLAEASLTGLYSTSS